MRNLFTPERIVFLLFGFLIGLLGDLVANWLGGNRTATLVFFLALGMVAMLALRLELKPKLIETRVEAITLRTPTEKFDNARRGLIVFVSYYNPIKIPEEERLPREGYTAAAQALDYPTLQLERSNLQPALEAIVTHAARLEHCWLVATVGKNGENAGSLPYVEVLVKYLQDVRQIHCHFHRGPEYTISLDVDSEVTLKTRNKIHAIFQEADALGLRPEEIVADFTGGFRSMALGLILACQARNRDIQFSGTHYDQDGHPGEDLFPILFNFEPKIQSSQ